MAVTVLGILTEGVYKKGILIHKYVITSEIIVWSCSKRILIAVA